MVSTTTLRPAPRHAAPGSDPAHTSPRAGFRRDVEGLRAIAVLLVVVFHAGWGPLSGGFVGVDVFFVISGFLITGLLADEVRRTRRLSLLDFYARRVRRLLPLSAVVLCTTALAALVVVPALDRPALAYDIRSAALWFANWHFAAGSTQYMADVDQSPVLHYWSLSVEEQFYVVWPLLVMLVAGHRSWRVTRNRLVLALGAALAGSLLLSGLTTGSGPWAYFGMHTRAWELAAGGLLALLAPELRRLPHPTALLAGAVGLVLVAASALTLDRASRFPGWVALVPVLGTVLLLLAGGRTTQGVSGWLAHPALTYVGRLSYGWYLWHWPSLVFARLLWGTAGDPDLGAEGASRLGLVPTLGAVAVSFGLAALTFRLVEHPVRSSRTLAGSRPLSIGLGSVLVATSLYAAVALHGSAADAATLDTSAAAQGQATTAAEARADTGSVPRCFVTLESDTVDPACRFGDPAGDRVVVLMGDSHAAHWFPALLQIAQRQRWQLWFWAKPACGWADQKQWNRQLNSEYTACGRWREGVLQRIEALPRVDAVVLGRAYAQVSSALGTGSGRPPGGDEGARRWAAGAQRTVERLARIAPSVVLLRDVPRPAGDVPSCLSKHDGDAGACAFPREGHVFTDTRLFEAEQRVLGDDPRVHVVDLTAAFCRSDPCPVVSARGTVIFRDRHHLTASFAREVAPLMERALVPLVTRR